MTTLNAVQEPGAMGLPEGLHEEFDQLLQALCSERRSAMVMCADTDELDQVSRALSRTLKHTPGIQLEVMRPTSTEALLGRFNERVEALPLEKARSARHVESTLTVWVMHLSRRLELPEVKLLLNMVHGFPGTGVRLLLLCSRDAASAEAAQVAARWGSRLHRWMIRPAPVAFEGPVVANPSPALRASAAAGTSAVGAPVVSTASAPARVVAPPSRMRRWSSAFWVWVRAWGARLKPIGRAGARVLQKAWRAFERVSRLDRLRAALVRRLRELQPRWAWGVGGVLMSVGATAAAWWQARPGGDDAALAPLRRPVPEIVELLEDARPHAVRQEQRS